jgi:hypothetical protein
MPDSCFLAFSPVRMGEDGSRFLEDFGIVGMGLKSSFEAGVYLATGGIS